MKLLPHDTERGRPVEKGEVAYRDALGALLAGTGMDDKEGYRRTRADEPAFTPNEWRCLAFWV